MHLRQVHAGGVAPALVAAMRAAVATAVASALAADCAHQAPNSEEERCSNNQDNYNRLCHSNNEPIWKNNVLTIQAKPMV